MENNNKRLDLKGKRFGRLVVLEKAENIIYPNKAITTQWKCKCDCGNLVTKRTQGLISGKTKSCGCLRNEIGNILGLKSNYVSKLLAQCSMYGLCDYNSFEEQDKGRKSLLKNSKKIICLDNGMIFQGAEECSRKSLEVFGIYLRGGCITRVCRKERKAYKGFHFEYVEE